MTPSSLRLVNRPSQHADCGTQVSTSLLDGCHGATNEGDLVSRVIDNLASTFERQLLASAAVGREGIGIDSPCICGQPLSAHYMRQETVAGRGRWVGCGGHGESVDGDDVVRSLNTLEGGR